MSGTETVTVACKLPNGIHLDVFSMEGHVEETPLGTRTVQRAVHSGRHTVKGVGRRKDDAGLSMGFALTHNVPKTIWDRWLAANKDSDIVKNGAIFARTKTPDVHAQSREHESIRTGLEPIDPKNLPREFRGKVETAEESPTKKLTG